MREVLDRTDGRVHLWPAALYGAIKRLLDADLIEESTRRPAPELDDSRRRYYRLTGLGRRVLTAESERLEDLVRLIRAKRDFRSQSSLPAHAVFEVVGVPKDVAEDLIASKKHPAIYFPLHPSDYAQPSLTGVTLMVRGRPGADVLGEVRREISATGTTLAPFNARAMTEQIAQFTSSLRSAAWTWNLIGAFGLILAVVGLARVTAYSVAQRRHEIGIRMALGAQNRDVLGLVMKEGAVLIAAGALIGMALTWAGIRLLSGIFFSVASVQAFDPALLLGAPLLLATLALLACYIPPADPRASIPPPRFAGNSTPLPPASGRFQNKL